jgi:SAM-dependent methyltransferase
MQPRALYDADAARWQRRDPNSLSDFTGRPVVFEMCGDVTGLSVLDVGAGEGYCAREIKQRGAASVLAIELSDEMVKLAKAQEEALNQGIDYRQGDARDLQVQEASFDLALAVFVFNYLDTEGMRLALQGIYRALRPGGHLVFAIPHPSFPFMRTTHTAPFYFDFQGRGYFSGKDSLNQGEIHCRDGRALRVQMVHKPLEEYFATLKSVGFTSMPEVREMRVLPEHLALDSEFFGPLNDIPLHMGFRVRR